MHQPLIKAHRLSSATSVTKREGAKLEAAASSVASAQVSRNRINKLDFEQKRKAKNASLQAPNSPPATPFQYVQRRTN
jgi:hypothetical protein